MTTVTEAVNVEDFLEFVPEKCPKSRRNAVAYFLGELSQIQALSGVIERVEKSLAYYRQKTPKQLGKYSQIYRSAITAWGQATGPQVWAYPLWDMSNETIRTELLQWLDAMAKVQPETESIPAPAVVPPELMELTLEALQKKRSKGASFAKLSKVVEDIQLINEMLPQKEKWAINSSVLRKVGGTRPVLVADFLKGNSDIAAYNKAQGLGFHQNKGRNIDELAALLEKPAAA